MENPKPNAEGTGPQRRVEEVLAAAGLTVEKAAELKAWITEQQQDGKRRKSLPDGFTREFAYLTDCPSKLTAHPCKLTGRASWLTDDSCVRQRHP
ncbi:MAG: hypothetical protein U1A53_14490 [Prosthecobacter sp.]|nr:hypothetical protein [Prosthecobacter sp.]